MARAVQEGREAEGALVDEVTPATGCLFVELSSDCQPGKLKEWILKGYVISEASYVIELIGICFRNRLNSRRVLPH